MHTKKDIIALGRRVLTTCPPNGIQPNQAHPTLPMVC